MKRRAMLVGLGALALPGVARAACQGPFPLALRDYHEVAELVSEKLRFNPVKLPGARKLGASHVYDDAMRFEGVSFGEYFVGQTVHAYRPGRNGVWADFDRISGRPDAPLRLGKSARNQNLSLQWVRPLSAYQLHGRGARSVLLNNALGEGAISILFESPQRRFGLRYNASTIVEPAGTMTIDAYRDDGTRLGVRVVRTKDQGHYGFETTCEQDLIQGVTITNSDPGGLGIYDVVYDMPSALTS